MPLRFFPHSRDPITGIAKFAHTEENIPLSQVYLRRRYFYPNVYLLPPLDIAWATASCAVELRVPRGDEDTGDRGGWSRCACRSLLFMDDTQQFIQHSLSPAPRCDSLTLLPLVTIEAGVEDSPCKKKIPWDDCRHSFFVPQTFRLTVASLCLFADDMCTTEAPSRRRTESGFTGNVWDASKFLSDAQATWHTMHKTFLDKLGEENRQLRSAMAASTIVEQSASLWSCGGTAPLLTPSTQEELKRENAYIFKQIFYSHLSKRGRYALLRYVSDGSAWLGHTCCQVDALLGAAKTPLVEALPLVFAPSPVRDVPPTDGTFTMNPPVMLHDATQAHAALQFYKDATVEGARVYAAQIRESMPTHPDAFRVSGPSYRRLPDGDHGHDDCVRRLGMKRSRSADGDSGAAYSEEEGRSISMDAIGDGSHCERQPSTSPPAAQLHQGDREETAATGPMSEECRMELAFVSGKLECSDGSAGDESDISPQTLLTTYLLPRSLFPAADLLLHENSTHRRHERRQQLRMPEGAADMLFHGASYVASTLAASSRLGVPLHSQKCVHQQGLVATLRNTVRRTLSCLRSVRWWGLLLQSRSHVGVHQDHEHKQRFVVLALYQHYRTMRNPHCTTAVDVHALSAHFCDIILTEAENTLLAASGLAEAQAEERQAGTLYAEILSDQLSRKYAAVAGLLIERTDMARMRGRAEEYATTMRTAMTHARSRVEVAIAAAAASWDEMVSCGVQREKILLFGSYFYDAVDAAESLSCADADDDDAGGTSPLVDDAKPDSERLWFVDSDDDEDVDGDGEPSGHSAAADTAAIALSTRRMVHSVRGDGIGAAEMQQQQHIKCVALRIITDGHRHPLRRLRYCRRVWPFHVAVRESVVLMRRACENAQLESVAAQLTNCRTQEDAEGRDPMGEDEAHIMHNVGGTPLAIPMTTVTPKEWVGTYLQAYEASVQRCLLTACRPAAQRHAEYVCSAIQYESRLSSS